MARHLLRLSTSVWVSWLTIYSLSSTSATQNGGRLSGTSSAGRPSVHPAAGLRTRDLKHPGNTCLHSFLVLSAVPGRHHIALRHLVHIQAALAAQGVFGPGSVASRVADAAVQHNLQHLVNRRDTTLSPAAWSCASKWHGSSTVCQQPFARPAGLHTPCVSLLLATCL